MQEDHETYQLITLLKTYRFPPKQAPKTQLTIVDSAQETTELPAAHISIPSTRSTEDDIEKKQEAVALIRELSQFHFPPPQSKTSSSKKHISSSTSSKAKGLTISIPEEASKLSKSPAKSPRYILNIFSEGIFKQNQIVPTSCETVDDRLFKTVRVVV
jgi:hypothetical protein